MHAYIIQFQLFPPKKIYTCRLVETSELSSYEPIGAGGW
jgi:hypothetical protein